MKVLLLCLFLIETVRGTLTPLIANDEKPPIKSITEVGGSTKQNKQCSFKFQFEKIGDEALLRSPNYPNEYPNNTNCQYFVSSLQGSQIELTCTDFNVEASNNCVYDAFYVSLTGDPNFSDQTYFCGNAQFSRTSISNQISMGFRSDGSNPPSNSIYRFECKLKAVAQSGCSCGVKGSSTRIIGGIEANRGEFPWRVAIYTLRSGVICGGSIISPNWVMTAAHCTNSLQQGEVVFVDIGDHDLSSDQEADNKILKVSQIIQNALYDDKTRDYDISLLRLPESLVFNRYVQPVCLPWKYRTTDFSRVTLTASGWGTMSFGGQQSRVLRKTSFPVITRNECNNAYPNLVTNNMFCTYEQGKDTCQGDSGGSADFMEPGSGRMYGIGITSWGVDCGKQGQPGVNVKVTNFLDWIQGNTGETFCKI